MHQETLSVDGLIDRLLTTFNIKDASVKSYGLDQLMLIVNHVFPGLTIDKKYLANRVEKLKKYRKQLQILKNLPIVEQRSPEWYELRKKIITASDFAQAFGDGKFGSQKQFFQKKCGYEQETFNPHIPPLKWGTMFEPVAGDLYSGRNGVVIHEFGLIQHPDVDYFGASPDGITENGIMVEIKCPFKRKITGEIPLQYFYQIQGQLDVCKLEECDYIECEFGEFADEAGFEAFKTVEDEDLQELESGIILEYVPQSNTKDSPKFVYSSICHESTDRVKVISWYKPEMEKLEADGYLVTPHFWYLKKMNVVRVYKNEGFVREKLEGLRDIWNKVQEYKADKDAYLKNIGSATSGSSASNKRNIDQVKLSGYSFI